jgi:ectoine hydroxylase-related dioxygenase (phytanoyl-CoA dioxygenase family)
MSEQVVVSQPSSGSPASSREPSASFASTLIRLRDVAPRLTAFSGLVEIRLADAGDASLFVQCPSGEVTDRAPSGEVLVAITLNSSDLIRIIDNNLDSRAVFGFKRKFDVNGRIADAMHFCDALQGVERRQPNLNPAILPKATPDLARAKADYERFGYCLLQDAISPETVARLRKRLLDQATAERDAGVATRDGGPNLPNQRVWHLPNKGQEFLDLLDAPVIDEFCPTLLGNHYVISSYSANIAGKGGEPMYLHYDQVFADPPIPNVRLGLNIAFFLDEVTEANGGTRLMPGNAKDGSAPDNPLSTDGTVAAEGPAGSALIWDSRVWHGTGSNTTDNPRHLLLLFFVRFFIRAQENYALCLRDDVKATLSDRVKTMLGFRVTNSLGGLGLGKEGSIVDRPAEPIGRLGPPWRA